MFPWPRHFIYIWKHLQSTIALHVTDLIFGMSRDLSQHPLQSLYFSGRSENQNGRPGLWLAETFSTSLKLLNGIQRYLTGSKISTSSTNFVFFGPIGKTRWLPWPVIDWDIFHIFSETAERNSTKLDRKQDLNVLHHVFVFRADRKNKLAVLTSDLLRHFQLLLCNRWTEFNKTWQEARSQRPLQRLCFWTDRKNMIATLVSDGRDIFDFSSETAEWNSTKQYFNVLYQVCIFGPIGKTRLPPWPLIGWDIFDFSFGKLRRGGGQRHTEFHLVGFENS